MSIGMPTTLYLLQFGELVFNAFGECPYQVGSSLRPPKDAPLTPSGKYYGWHDIDVRLILLDDRYLADYGDPEHPKENRRWVATCMAWSALGERITQLPIDFQIQAQTYANKEFSTKDGHLRSAMFSWWEAKRGD